MTISVLEVLPLALLLLVGCAKSPPPLTEQDVVRGTVSYRERIALPPDAVVLIYSKGIPKPLRFVRIP